MSAAQSDAARVRSAAIASLEKMHGAAWQITSDVMEYQFPTWNNCPKLEDRALAANVKHSALLQRANSLC